MIPNQVQRKSTRTPRGGRSAFTLIELLVVISIIALLIAILVPSLHGARKSAKNAKTKALIKGVAQGLESFKGENENQFRQSGGYPSSHMAEDPALPGEQDVYGAHWLVRGLMGKDLQGFIPRRNVPSNRQDRSDTTEEQVDWYDPTQTFIDRGNYYALDTKALVRTGDLPGTRNDNLWPSRSVDDLPLFVDAFGYPVLYYAANPYSRVIATAEYPDPDGGVGIYVHQDNAGFTGFGNEVGWLFKSRFPHKIQEFGVFLNNDPEEPDKGAVDTFIGYIHSHAVHEQTSWQIIQPFKKDSFLLITAGEDGRYGTADDVNNFER